MKGYFSVQDQVTKKSPRYEFLDGIRGIASFMVVISHLPSFAAVPALVASLGWGNPWVAIFITLSGFCLYLPAAGRAQVEMPRPFWEFMARRARRILPAWYASLVLCILVGVFFARVGYASPFHFLPQNAIDVITHLTLTHSMTNYSGSINGPGYTLGTEWQLYILLILFLGVARRAGWTSLLILGIVLGVVAGFLPLGPISKIVGKIFSPDFTMPFLLGVFGARTVRNPPPSAAYTQSERFIWLVLFIIGVVGYGLINHHTHTVGCWLMGLATTALCVLLARNSQSLPAIALSSPPAKRLGDFSYSLYLTHFPLLALAAYVGSKISGNGTYFAFYVIQLPAFIIALVFAYLFHLAFEKPYLNTNPAKAAAR